MFFISVAGVSALQEINQTTTENANNLANEDELSTYSGENETFSANSDDTTFQELQNEIDAGGEGGTIDLERDYTWGHNNYAQTNTKAKSETTVTGHTISADNTNGIIADIILPGDATGNITITITNKTTTYDISTTDHTSRGGKTAIFIHNEQLNPGKYNITATYEGNEYYNKSTDNNTFTITKVPYTPNINVNDTIVTVEIPENATGNMTLTIGNQSIESPIENGTAKFDLSGIPDGNYNTTISYTGDDIYEEFKEIVPVSICSPIENISQ